MSQIWGMSKILASAVNYRLLSFLPSLIEVSRTGGCGVPLEMTEGNYSNVEHRGPLYKGLGAMNPCDLSSSDLSVIATEVADLEEKNDNHHVPPPQASGQPAKYYPFKTCQIPVITYRITKKERICLRATFESGFNIKGVRKLFALGLQLW
jgi:hypothetical protein